LCAYEIILNTTITSGAQNFDIVFDTTNTGFISEWSSLAFTIDNTSFPWLQTDMGVPISSSDISWLAHSASFITQNPGISMISNTSKGASQVSYNNWYLTWFAVSITSKNVSDIILSGFVVGQVGINKFGSGWYDIPHTIILLGTTGNVISTGNINQSGNIIFHDLNYIIPAGQTYNLSMMVAYTGNVKANWFRFQWSYRDTYDMSGHQYGYPTSIPGISIDILENTVTVLNTFNPWWGLIVNNLSGIYLWQMRFSSSTPSSIKQIALINVNQPFYGTYVSSWTLACSTNSLCSNISTWWDGLKVYITHNNQVISSGTIVSGAVILPLSTTISIYDQWDLIDIYAYDPDGIQQANETNKTIKLWLLDTQNILNLGWQSVQTIITSNSTNNDLVANFDDTIIIYDQYHIRDSILSANIVSALSGYQDINDIMYHTWVSLLWVELQSTGAISYLYQLVFTHESTAQVDNLWLTIDWDTNPNHASCVLNSWLITCTMTGAYANGLAIDSTIHTILLTADITGWVVGTGDHITTKLLNSTPQDYGMYDVASIPSNHSIIHSDGSDPSLTPLSVNWFIDAGISLNNVNLEYNVWGIDTSYHPVTISNASYTHTSNNYVFSWDPYTTGFVTIFIQNITASWSYIQRASVPASSWVTPPITIGTTASYHVKFVATTATGISVWPDHIISLTHTGITPLVFLIGNSNPFVELWWFFFDVGAYWDDGTIQWSDNIIISGTINTYQTGVYLITYNYADSFGNAAAQLTRTVTVRDTTAPVITISWWDIIWVEYWSTYLDAGATVSDNSTGATITISGTGMVDTMTLWNYYISYEYTDPSGNTGYATRTVIVQDTIAPVVQLSGNSIIDIAYNSGFVDPGALWNDARDGSGLIYSEDTVPNIVWSHPITYHHQDAAWNNSTIVSRTVRVIDSTIPIITLRGPSTITIEAGSSYVDSGASYYDDVAWVWEIIASGNVNRFVPGTYVLSYDYMDASWNTGVTQMRTVTVQDTTAPTISLIGWAGVIIAQWLVYHESWAQWSDIVDGSWYTLVSWSVNTDLLGTYYVDYNYTDASGNTGATQTRIVTVTDQTAPLVSLNGSSIITILLYTNYIDSGALWSDNIDGSGTIAFPLSWSVQTWVIGTYVLTYSHTDKARNTGSVTRTVHVVSWNMPMITLNGSGTMTLPYQSSYLESGAIYYDSEDGTWIVSMISGSVNATITGTYVITYDYTDSQGNKAIQQTRTIHIIPPMFSTGQELSSSWTNLNCNPCVAWAANVTTWGSCNLCSIKYTNNTGHTSNTGSVMNIDTVWPTIFLVGDSFITLQRWSSYIELGARWNDIVDWSWSISKPFSWSVNTQSIGTYVLYYGTSDSAWNTGNIVTRTVSVTDIISMNSNAPSNLPITIGWWWLHTTVQQSEPLHWSAPVIKPLSKRDEVLDQYTPSADQIVSIRIWKDGSIILIKVWDRTKNNHKKIFAKNLNTRWIIATGSVNRTWNQSDKTIVLKKYRIITSEMLQDISILQQWYQPTWDATPYQSRRTLAPTLTTQSTSFYRKLVDRMLRLKK
jgi:Domain of unknown function (DUF5011)